MTEDQLQKVLSNEDFFNLILEARKNDELREALLYALKSDDETRIKIIKAWVKSSLEDGATREFCVALSYFVYPEVAAEVLPLLSK